MTAVMNDQLPINSAARNALWIYDALAEPRFAGAPAIVEPKRSYEMPNFNSLPEGANIAVELYGGSNTSRSLRMRRLGIGSGRCGERSKH